MMDHLESRKLGAGHRQLAAPHNALRAPMRVSALILPAAPGAK